MTQDVTEKEFKPLNKISRKKDRKNLSQITGQREKKIDVLPQQLKANFRALIGWNDEMMANLFLFLFFL